MIQLTEEMLAFIYEKSEDGIIRLNNNKILHANRMARKILNLEDREGDIVHILGKENWQKIQGKEEAEVLYMGELFLAFCTMLSDGSMYLILRKDKEKNVKALFDNYNEDTLYICDGEGNTIWTGKDVADNCGVTREYILEHNVLELERERIFYPSVSVKALKSKKVEIVTQITASGNRGIAIAVPISDATGKIEKIVSFTKDLNRALLLGDQIASYASEEIEDDELKLCSLDSKILSDKIKAVSRNKVNFVVTGEEGCGKSVIAKSVCGYRKIDLQRFITIDCKTQTSVKLGHTLFGTGKKTGIFYGQRGQVIYFTEITALSFKLQEMLAEYLENQEGAHQIIFGTSENLGVMCKKNLFSMRLYKQISKVEIHLEPLRKRTIDIPALVLLLQKEINTKYGIHKIVDKEVTWAFCCYSWPGNIRQLRQVMEQLFLSTNQTYIDISMLPKEISGVINTNTKKGLLQEMVDQFEKSFIEMALEDFLTFSEAAVYLGVNQSTISRKAQKYGIYEKGKKGKKEENN